MSANQTRYLALRNQALTAASLDALALIEVLDEAVAALTTDNSDLQDQITALDARVTALENA